MSDVLYAIDPGTEQSALVLLSNGCVAGWILPNAELVRELSSVGPNLEHLVLEQVESYGMAVGRDVFETVFWSGRFIQAWESACCPARAWSRLGRKAVKLALCGSVKAKDANVRQAIVDRYGGKEKAIGRKAAPGPLYGIRSHCWSALALALAHQESNQ